MKYLEVEVEGAPEQGGLRLWGNPDGIGAKLSNERCDRLRISDLIQWAISDARILMRCALDWSWLIDLQCSDAWSVYWLVLQCWLRCSIDVFVFRFALVISNLVICSVYWVLVFFFFFFFENPWVCFTCLPSVGLFFL